MVWTASTSNLSNLAAPQFKLVFHKLPKTVFRCQSVNVPGLNLSEIEQPSPTQMIPIPGDALTYDELNISFVVDEDLANWREIQEWIIGLGFPNSTDEYKALKATDTTRTKFGGLYSDATVISLTNNSLANKQFIYRNCFPISLTGIDFDSGDTEIGPIISDASFRFMQYTIESL